MNRDNEPNPDQEPLRVSASEFLNSLSPDESADSPLELTPLLIAHLGLETADQTGETFRWKSELHRQIFGGVDFTATVSFGFQGVSFFELADVETAKKTATASDYHCGLKLFPDTPPKGNS